MITGMPVESSVRGDVHAEFGGRAGETDQPRGWHRAPARPYVPELQVGGQVVGFMTAHLGNPIPPSPAIFERIGNRFRREVKAFAAANDVPILQLRKPDRSRFDDRKLDHIRPYLDRAEAEGRTGVVAIVAAQEHQWVFSARDRSAGKWLPSFAFVKQERRVGTYYCYCVDAEFGPGFIKVCSYFPYPAKVCVNAHSWACDTRTARCRGNTRIGGSADVERVVPGPCSVACPRPDGRRRSCAGGARSSGAAQGSLPIQAPPARGRPDG